MVSPQYELSYVYQKHSSVKNFLTKGALLWFLPSMNSHIGCMDMLSPQHEFTYTSQWKVSPQCVFKMSYKINIQQYCLVTLVTLVWFCHYASSHGLLNYLSLWNSCHIPLIWFILRMYFEMTCKITIPWRGILTLTGMICFYLEFIFAFLQNVFSNDL